MSSSTIFHDSKVYAAEQFKEALSEPSPNTNLYIVIAKADAWANDASPDTAYSTEKAKYTLWSNMIGGKRLVTGDISHVIPRNDWLANTVYIAYDDNNPYLFAGNNQFYVITNENKVYKCISNNYSAPSTTKPTSTNPSITSQTADGYIWKYMYTIEASEILRFANRDYIPVKTLTTDTGAVQWSVQQNAVDGGIHSIVLENFGVGYTNANNIIVTVSGNGTGATAIANLNLISETVSTVTITNPGSGYTYANVSITGGEGSNAQARAIMSPPGGHGSDPVYELGGNSLIINAKLNFSENGKLPTENEYRQIGLLKDPYIKGTSNVFANSAFSQFYQITTSGSGDYTNDEFVYQGASLGAATFSGRVLKYDSANGIVYTINNSGTLSSDALIGANTVTSRFVTTFTEGELRVNSGKILYINNIKPITRSPTQQETFQILINF